MSPYIFKKDNFFIYFGDASCGFKTGQAKDISVLKQKFNLDDVVYLKQTHSNKGYLVTSENKEAILNLEGDFLITKQSHIPIAIFTADCLPIIFIDNQLKIAAVAHAGWRGAIAGIITNTLNEFFKLGSKPENICAYFGSSAKVCCYEVQEDFVKNLNGKNQFIISKNEKLYFDLPAFALDQILDAGILIGNINLDYNLCTICNHQFASHRRDPESRCRQISLVSILS